MKKLQKELEFKIQEALEKSKDKDKMLFHQNKLMAMGEMMENIAHQWRQPLAQINSSVLLIDDMLHEDNHMTDEIDERLLEIESLTKYLSKTIDDFRGFIDKDKEKKTFYLGEIIKKSVYIIHGSIKKNNIDLSFNIDNDFKYYGYEGELQQVLVIIFNNAKDVLVERGIKNPKIRVNIVIENSEVVIKISDNAGGIDKKDIDRIFEPYFSTKHKTQGTGLGLYIAKKIIEDSLGGNLSVNNTNDGACFEIAL